MGLLWINNAVLEYASAGLCAGYNRASDLISECGSKRYICSIGSTEKYHVLAEESFTTSALISSNLFGLNVIDIG